MQMKRNKNTTPIAKPMMQTVGLVILLLLTSLAWFVFDNYVDLSSLEVDVKDATNVWISNSTDKDSWSDNLVYTGEVDGGLYSITEYSGNGTQLYLPIVRDKQVMGYFPVSENMDQNYLEFSVFIKSDGPINIFLGDGSSVTPIDLGSNLSSDGDFSKDYIVGAVRVALYTEENKDNPIVWAPNSQIEYTEINNSITTLGQVENNYTYAIGKGINDMKVIPTDGKNAGIDSDGNFLWGEINKITDKSNMKPILQFDGRYGTENVKEVKIRVWVEGTDREAISALIGGKFKLNIKFDSAEIENRGENS